MPRPTVDVRNMLTDLFFDELIEQETRIKLIEHFTKAYGNRVESHVDALLSLQSDLGRFRYLQNKIGLAAFSPEQSILISGFSVGSEMLVAKTLGFGEIHGVEVSRFYYETCKQRVGHISGMHPQLYDGLTLPYENNRFSVVESSHVIEHTQSPEMYVSECMRVLAPEGFLVIEFPHRYYPVELHTGVRSYEWLPRIIRNLVLSLLSGGFSPLHDKDKKLYKQILTTNLQQISMGRIKISLENCRFLPLLWTVWKRNPGLSAV